MSMLSFDEWLLKGKYGDAEVVILMIFVVLKSYATNLQKPIWEFQAINFQKNAVDVIKRAAEPGLWSQSPRPREVKVAFTGVLIGLFGVIVINVDSGIGKLFAHIV